MELVKEINGWKLFKNDRLNDYTVETPEGIQHYYKVYDVNSFNRTVERGWVWVDVEYYMGSINRSEIIITKLKKQYRSNQLDNFYKTHCTTREDMMERMEPILVEAEKKFETIKEKIMGLKKDLDFNLGYVMEGDTYGIYDDYQYISFDLYGVRCDFELDI